VPAVERSVETEPLVSVVMPVRDGAPFLREAIESVLDQSHPRVELVVVDDGSTDDSAQIAGSFGERLLCVSAPPRGAGAARNQGVDLATGEFLAFIDADDLWPRTRLAVLLEAFRRRPQPDLVFGRLLSFPGESEPVTALVASTLLLRRRLFARVGGFAPEWRVGEFMEWLLRARELNLREVMLEDVVLHRRVHPDSLTAQGHGHYGDYARILRASLARRRASGA
jgi:glycosyltransferase involved in cell wall biosynthesis